MKIVTVIGARPQFIKAAVVSRWLRETPGCEEILVHTGQHYDENMSDVFFQELEIPKPTYHLGIGSGGHGAQTGRMLEAIEKVLLECKPDKLLIYGDTNSTLAGALAAAKLHVPVAHVEAGLRSFNRKMPEEINRVVADHVSMWLFAPTAAAVHNLRNEGVAENQIFLVGDVMYDAAIYFGTRTRADTLSKLGLQSKNYVLATIHRAENTDAGPRLRGVFAGLSAIADELPVVLPLHPRTRAALNREKLLDKCSPNLRLVDPLGYLDMVMLEKHASVIATDSGGVQKEAFFHRVPCVTLRDETEWVELVELGWNRLVPPTDADTIEAGVLASLRDTKTRLAPAELYGGGQAGEAITRLLQAA
ncbi:MAG: UDP-N-acetylglucosamine 2-epimerase (non-hydrolyzing) [Gemmataceae bacterium]|nr:UDP-N-acetylglucosamine 2-epimerase (non-hydrolyzing) [Gemmataceae bacterium]